MNTDAKNREHLAVRADPQQWFQGWGRFRDEATRQPSQGKANVLQRRMFEHYRRRKAEDRPCRMVVLKYRRAGSSTGSQALIYTHAHNFNARLGVIGTDYKASANMLQMLEFFGEHDDFKGWAERIVGYTREYIPGLDWHPRGRNDETRMTNDEREARRYVSWDDRIDKIVTTKILWSHGSSAELYTATNPESARSAGLNGFHATEVGRWPAGGQYDAMETLSSMRNALPKSGFHLAIEESTANGAQGAFYDTCWNARWPEYASWPELHKSCWPLTESEYGGDLQYVFIFAAWFEDERHIERITPEAVRASDPALSLEKAAPLAAERNAARDLRVEQTLDAEPWYFGERELIARYGEQGPHGMRLGAEVEGNVWEQLAWRRGIIRNVCTRRGLDEFAQEYPSNPLEAFRTSGAPVFDHEGITALDAGLRAAAPCESGILEIKQSGGDRVCQWRRTSEAEAQIQQWEPPIPGCRYMIVIDPTKTAEIVKGTGERDRNSVLVLRDGFADERGRWRMVKLVARLRPPNQWEDAPLARAAAALSLRYGGAHVAVESNLGSGLITRLRDEHHTPLYTHENFEAVRLDTPRTYGWNTTADSRRHAISTLQEYICEQRLEILCPNVIAELKSFVFNARGRPEAASGAHDDDVMALAIGLACLPRATAHPVRAAVIQTRPVDEHLWSEV